MDYAKCWDCGPTGPWYPSAILLLAMVGLLVAVWRAMRPPPPPSWWRTDRHRRGK
jgi:hypothetical protein